MGGWGIFKVSLHSWQRGTNSPILWRPLLYCLPTLPSFQILSKPTPSPHFPVASNPTLTVLSVILFLWLKGWSRHIRCATLLNDNMDLHMSSLGTLVPRTRRTLIPQCVFYATRRQIYWGLTHNVVFYW